MLDLQIHQAVDPGLDEREVGQLVEAAFQVADRRLPAVSVSFVAPETIQELNLRHRGKDRPTDVLSFMFDDSFPHGPGGEVIICPALAEQSATEDDRDTADELALLVVHGVLHLLGYEDETAAGRSQMDRLTTTALATLGDDQ